MEAKVGAIGDRRGECCTSFAGTFFQIQTLNNINLAAERQNQSPRTIDFCNALDSEHLVTRDYGHVGVQTQWDKMTVAVQMAIFLIACMSGGT
jgi:hypothetical protein